MTPDLAEDDPAGRGRLRVVFKWMVAGIFIGLAWRQLHFVETHAVNILYWDQWDFYKPLFLGQSWWETFNFQHGPHREGVGLVVMRILANLSGWDSRWDAFAESLIMIGAAGLGVRLALRFGVRAGSLALAAVPLLFLNVLQYEIFLGAVNLSHGALPMLMFMGYCLCWFVSDGRWRILAIGVLTFLLIFTGFGLFVGFLTPVLLATECLQAWRAREKNNAGLAALGLAASGASWALFAHGYQFQPGAPGFHFPYERPSQYVVFLGRMLGNFFGAPMLSVSGVILGLLVACLLAAICAWHGRRVAMLGVRREPRSVVLFCLSAFTLLYCVNTAIGRVHMGPSASLASRYVTLLIPGGLALFLQFALLGRRLAWEWPALVYSLLLIPGACIQRPLDAAGILWYTEGRIHWKAAYLETHDEAQADKIANFAIYPGPIGDRLEYLRERHLNLFAPPD